MEKPVPRGWRCTIGAAHGLQFLHHCGVLGLRLLLRGWGGLADELGGLVERAVPQGEGRAQRLFVLLLQPHPIHHGAESHPVQQPSDFYKSALENLSRAT